MTLPRAWEAFRQRPKRGHQTIAFTIFDTSGFDLVWIYVDVDWLREEASINDLKELALEAYSKKQKALSLSEA